MTNLFREAQAASPTWNVTKTLLQTCVFWTVFLVFLPAVVYQLETVIGLGQWRFAGLPTRAIGVAVFVAAGALGLASGVTMALQGRGTPLPVDCPRQIVVAGPYAYVRNPMALAGLAQGVAVGLFLGSPAVILYALAGGPVWNYLVRPAEERDLEARFGQSFRDYQAAVRCWWPRLRPYRPTLASLLSTEANESASHAEREQA